MRMNLSSTCLMIFFLPSILDFKIRLILKSKCFKWPFILKKLGKGKLTFSLANFERPSDWLSAPSNDYQKEIFFSYVNLYAEYKQAEEENFNLERKVKQLESKYNQARAQMATEIEEKENLQRQLTEMENTLNLMKEIVFENSDNVNKVGFHLAHSI